MYRSPRSPSPPRVGAVTLAALGLVVQAAAAHTDRIGRGRAAIPGLGIGRSSAELGQDTASMMWSPDSVGTLEDLQRRQADFERLRRRFLPFVMGRIHPCDLRIGRFCYWENDDPPPEATHHEDPRVSAARDVLLAALDSVASMLPGDDWVAAQRVRYRLDGGDTAGAMSSARACRATPWWCAALEGLAHHSSYGFAAAEAAFDRALGEMPDSLRSEWEDVRKLIGTRESPGPHAAARAFWLADPLFLVPGNERRSEHFARRVMIRIAEESATPREMRWGDDSAELALRFGWPTWWAQQAAASGFSGAQTTIVSGEPRRGEQFVPPAAIVARETGNRGRREAGLRDAEPWPPLHSDDLRERWAYPLVTEFGELEVDVMVFWRGEHAIVATAFEPPSGAHAAEVGLFVQADGGAKSYSAVDSGAGSDARLIVEVPTTATLGAEMAHREVLLSVEALRRADSIAARHRTWLDLTPPTADAPVLSPLVLIEDSGDAPRTLADALGRARPPGPIAAGSTLHVYWEVVPIRPDQPSRVSLTVERARRGVFRRVGEWVGLASRDADRVALQWTAAFAPTDPAPGSAVSVKLPSRDGRYRLQVTVTLPGGRRVETGRELDLRQP